MSLARSNPNALTSDILMQVEALNETYRAAYQAGYKAGYAKGRLEAATEAQEIVKKAMGGNHEPV